MLSKEELTAIREYSRHGITQDAANARALLAHIDTLTAAVRRLSDAITDQAAIGSDGLFPANREFDARQEYLAALKAVRTILNGEPHDA